MQGRYKVLIRNRYIYKEIELLPEYKEFTVGTETDCDYRLRKDLFLSEVSLTFIQNNGAWSVYCSDNIYINVGDIRKLSTTALTHGDLFNVCYQDSDNDVFILEFSLDFDNGQRKYERGIRIASVNTLSIGTANSNNVVISSAYVNNDSVELRSKSGGYELLVYRTTYGVYHNGSKVMGTCFLKNGDFFSISDFIFCLKDGYLWTEIREGIYLNGLKCYDYPNNGEYPKFNRNSRIKTVISDEKIEVLDPPAKPQKPKSNLFTRLLPSMGMMLASVCMAFFGGMMIAMSLISGVMAVITTIVSIKQGNKEYETASAERIEKYNTYIYNKRNEIQECRNQEYEELEDIYISQNAEIDRFMSFSSDLFDRSRDDEDFLCVRFGSGEVESKREINYKKQERLEIEDELQSIPEQLCYEFKNVPYAPIVCNFKEINALGIVGALGYRFEFLKNIVIDITARHYHSDVKTVFISEEKNKDRIRWLRLLPHAYNEYMGIRNMVYDDESKNIVFEYLYKELTAREQNKSYDEHIVVFFFDEYGFKSHPISKFINKAKDLGVTFVFFSDSNADVPLGCDYIVSIYDSQIAYLINTQDKNKTLQFAYPIIDTVKAEKIVNLLAPVYTEEISLEGTLTKNISLFELLNILAVDDINLQKNWENSQVFRSMSAPLGISKTGVVSLDLHDKAHGPHGLVAGTTGSGKSEILQTYILSMATLFHPYEVGFVIIDFKGGGMVNQFKTLPHLLGAITNIDGKEIDRSLKSIKAELQKRQRLFADADVNHIDKYIRKYKAGEVSVPLPHLIIIVDEFAELKAEQPEFMKELISAARIGRSLGVHLILATQKPSGQVNEQIWSNSRFKLCLKVQSQEDSNEVIKSPLASEIKEPGRAYLQVGNNEIFELFQSAYSGAPEKIDDSNVKEFTVYNLTDSGRRVPVFSQKRKKSGEGSATQLDAVVKYVSDYCNRIKLNKLPDICLPSLESCIEYTPQKKTEGRFDVEIGVYDDPDNQYQGVCSVDIGTNNLMIIGSSQSGKTNMLQSIIRGIATKYTPEEVSVYIIDFASMVLKNFEKLNHVGGVVCPSEDEKLKNLFKLLNTEIEQRKEKLLSVGVSSFAAYREAGKKDIPQLVLIIDNLTALKELYFQDDDELLNLCREGLTVGLSIIIANAQTAGIGYKYLSNFSSRIALFCNDSNEYSSLFDHCRERLDSIPGRCIIEVEKRHLECQSYLAFKGEKEIDRVNDIKSFIASVNELNKMSRAKRIPLIPASLTKDFMIDQFGDCMQEDFSVVSGLDYATVSPFVIDFASLGLIAVTGREKSGKHNWVKYSVDMLDSMYNERSSVYIVDGVGKKLGSLKNKENVVSYSILAEDAVARIKEIEVKLKERYDALVAGNESVLDEAELLVLVLDNQDAIAAICSDSSALNAYKNIIGRYKNMKACIIAFIDNANIPYGAPEMLKNIRESHHMMYFDDVSNMKVFDVPLSVARGFKKPIDLGDGYYFKDNECVKVKTAISIIS